MFSKIPFGVAVMGIRLRLSLGFLLVILISAATGAYAVSIIGRTTALTAEIYDRPLMASSFALSATADFLRADRALVAATVDRTGSELRRQTAAILGIEATINDDLAVVEERFPDARGSAMVADVRTLLGSWEALVQQMTASNAANLPAMLAIEASLRDSIEAKLDILVEGAKEEGLNFRNEAAAIGKASYRLVLGAVTLTAVAGIVIALLIARGICRPIAAMTKAMAKLAAGETDVSIPASGRRDELGKMAKSVLVFKDGMATAARLALQQHQDRERTTAEKIAALRTMADKVEAETATALAQVNRHTASMTASADDMAASAGRAGNSAHTAAIASNQALSNTQTVATAADELRGSIDKIGGLVAQSSTVVGQAIRAGEQTRSAIQALNEQVVSIGAVSDMIGEIASKTNLLALNATIEAARAGGVLRLDEVDLALPFNVCRIEDGKSHLEFDLNDATRVAFEPFLQRLSLGPAA